MTENKSDNGGDVVPFEKAKSPHEYAKKERRMETMKRRFKSATKQILATGRKGKRGKKGKRKGGSGGKGGWSR
ncbi:MAG: hypothetical protein CMQ05_01980 [Gammaproteobacteria bacterium]|uniref:Uncharacterized protein n=1 Tax=OM182 bacterium MED-G24 TaxID=1986255 RepID=A0A2A5WZP7_9GAMM|nr:hypothetical protein [Gammaproteobacteria bacterium]PDH41687.1 MAG: hypothetical protein CNE99_01290 [OM182 bacterium MED-G24]RPG26649.1 MAG: hypothetical protein CBC10_003765 [Gammaproteobacteria bacterium TMED50]